MSRRTITIIVGFAISAALIYFIAKGIDIERVAIELKGANYWWLIPNIVVILFGMYQRAWRWGSMTRPIKKVAFRKLLSSTAVGFMANNVLPLRLGEFVRAYSLSSQDKGISKSASLAMIFTERIVFDLTALLVIFGIVLATTSMEVPEDVKSGSLLILVIALVGYLFAMVFGTWQNQIASFASNNLGFLPARARSFVVDAIGKFSLGLQFMKNPLDGLWVLTQTGLIWFLLGISNYFIFIAFGLDLPLEASFATLAVVSIMILVPSSPGFIGVYHAGVILTLSQYGVSPEVATACAVVMHATQYVVVTLYGLYHLWRSHLSLREVEQIAVDENE